MDFLSWRKLHPEVQADSIMLNSLTLLPKRIPSLHPYAIIKSFLDHDEARDRATRSRPNHLRDKSYIDFGVFLYRIELITI